LKVAKTQNNENNIQGKLNPASTAAS